jgi:hypothetical protein
MLNKLIGIFFVVLRKVGHVVGLIGKSFYLET